MIFGCSLIPFGNAAPPPISEEVYFTSNTNTGLSGPACFRNFGTFLGSDFQPFGADGLKAALRATDKAMMNFALTLLSSCAKHHVEKNGTIWRVADNFGWKLDRFNLPPGAAARSREPGIIQQVAQQVETSCAERLRVSERQATERVAAAEKEAERWKALVKKWKKTASDRQIEVCSLRQANENLTAEIGAFAPLFISWFLSESEPLLGDFGCHFRLPSLSMVSLGLRRAGWLRLTRLSFARVFFPRKGYHGILECLFFGTSTLSHTPLIS